MCEALWQEKGKPEIFTTKTLYFMLCTGPGAAENLQKISAY